MARKGKFGAHFAVIRPGVFWIHLLSGVLAIGAVVSRADGQDLVAANQMEYVKQLFENKRDQNSLKCHVHPWGPVFGFNLEYRAGFLLSPESAQVALGEKLVGYLRVTPEQRAPVLLAVSYNLPATPPQVADGQPFTFTLTGDFAVGEGRYEVELLLLDSKKREFYARWKLRTSGHAVDSTLKSFTVAAVLPDGWDGKLDPNGVRLTLLLDATESSPKAARLRPFTRDYLMKVLGTILREVRCRSVKVVAFNLDEQNEIFREDNFDSGGYAELGIALRKLQSSTVSYRFLEPSAWQKFLVGLTEKQIAAADRPDAVVFIGTPTHFVQKPPAPQPAPSGRRVSIFYFEYFAVLPVFIDGNSYPAEFPTGGAIRDVPDGGYYAPSAVSSTPDAIAHLTQELHGTVFRIASPKDVGPAIQKMRAEIAGSKNGSVVPAN
jgi:hypothetical protein